MQAAGAAATDTRRSAQTLAVASSGTGNHRNCQRCNRYGPNWSCPTHASKPGRNLDPGHLVSAAHVSHVAPVASGFRIYSDQINRSSGRRGVPGWGRSSEADEPEAALPERLVIRVVASSLKGLDLLRPHPRRVLGFERIEKVLERIPLSAAHVALFFPGSSLLFSHRGKQVEGTYT